MGLRARLVLLLFLFALPLSTSCSMRPKVEGVLPKGIVQVDKNNYNAMVLKSKGPCLVLFYDEGIESTALHRLYIAFADRYGKHAKFCRYKWDGSDNPDSYRLEVQPTIILYRDGIEIDRLRGIPPRTSDYVDWNEDVELWVLRTAIQVKSDKYTATFNCFFNNTYDLEFTNLGMDDKRDVED